MSQVSLQETVESLKQEVARLQAIHDVQNLAARYELYHTPKTMWRTVELFALKTPGVRAQLSHWGIWEGAKGIKLLFEKVLHPPEVGTMFEHHLTTPYIEIAKDCKTAKGVWFSPGHETHPSGPDESLMAYWVWGRYALDFIKEDGEWKIWHLRWYTNFKTPYDTSWLDAPLPKPASRILDGQPDKPSFNNRYTRTSVREIEPVPPEPYDTWDEE